MIANKKKNGWSSSVGKTVLAAGALTAMMATGAMAAGWQQEGSDWYYLDNNGAMIVGWLYDGRWYYLDADPSSATYGKMLTDTFVIWNGNSYYVDANGLMATGWTEIRGNWYYFRTGSGEMARNEWVDTFYLNENGIWQR